MPLKISIFFGNTSLKLIQKLIKKISFYSGLQFAFSMWKFHWFYSENYEVAWLHISSENLLIQNPFSKSLHQALVKFRKDPQRKYCKFCKRLPPFCLCYDRAMCALILQAYILRGMAARQNCREILEKESF